MTAETMGTRGGRGSSPEENAWVGERDNPWASMGESPGPFADITHTPREPAERPDPFGPGFSENFAAELLENKQGTYEARGKEIIGNLKEKGQEALSGLREKAKGGLNKLMNRTMKGVYATVGWGAETVAKGRQFAADKEKRSEERKAKRAMARKQRIMDREKRRVEIDGRRSDRKAERDSLDRGDAIGRHQRRDVKHVRKTETGILSESRKELGDVQKLYKEKQNTVSEARAEKESANADLQRAKDEYLKDINQESRKRLVEAQERKSLADQNYENIKADLKDLRERGTTIMRLQAEHELALSENDRRPSEIARQAKARKERRKALRREAAGDFAISARDRVGQFLDDAPGYMRSIGRKIVRAAR